MSQAEELLLRVDAIKKHINELSRDAKQSKSDDSKGLIAVIKDLNNVIEGKETEIKILMTQIEKQSELIESQKVVIKQKDEQLIILDRKKWFDMGTELLSVYEEYEDIKGGMFNGKNKDRMEANKTRVLLKARNCFQQALNLGHTAAINNINAINALLK